MSGCGALSFSVSGSVSGALCVGARRSLCRADSVSGPAKVMYVRVPPAAYRNAKAGTGPAERCCGPPFQARDTSPSPPNLGRRGIAARRRITTSAGRQLGPHGGDIGQPRGIVEYRDASIHHPRATHPVPRTQPTCAHPVRRPRVRVPPVRSHLRSACHLSGPAGPQLQSVCHHVPSSPRAPGQIRMPPIQSTGPRSDPRATHPAWRVPLNPGENPKL